MQEEEIMYG
ncbi:Protein of unknown function [Bacillus thuringiensis]|uniref:Uncharacterized protein n=1 Tax=Bacillus thuringiensis TaxID=1428 RepID=A0A1C4CDR7_BACTU|nr:Protein of unknown function [Bacillus thuringiensis]